MTDKQIIINGVDVSGCKHYEDHTLYDCNETCEINGGIVCTKCKDNPNCYYKQLKHKEQEYEELRQYHNKCCKENAKKLEEWLKKYNQISRGFYNGDYCNIENCSLLKAKEQECEELKKYLNQIRDEELSHLDIEWDEYETSVRQEDYSNIITLVERALGEIND